MREETRDGLNKSVDRSSTHRKLSRAAGLFRVSLDSGRLCGWRDKALLTQSAVRVCVEGVGSFVRGRGTRVRNATPSWIHRHARLRSHCKRRLRPGLRLLPRLQTQRPRSDGGRAGSRGRAGDRETAHRHVRGRAQAACQHSDDRAWGRGLAATQPLRRPPPRRPPQPHVGLPKVS